MSVTVEARLRAREVLAVQLAVSEAEWQRTGRQFCRGARDALSWLLGGGPAPLSGTPHAAPLKASDIVAELAAAEAKMGRHDAEPCRYAQGVEHALMWAQLVTPAPPVPAPRPPTN